MAFDRDVTIDINADISGYSTSLSQAIATTENFSKAADTLLGRITKLNGISATLIKNTTSLTGANKLAVAQAAAYQQKLSGIEATAKVTGTSFVELEKTTKRFARDFPVGINGAVEVVQTLQESGVTANKEIQQLGKGFISLGAATGQSMAGIGKQFLELNRTFGKSYNDFGKLSDSLVQVTKQYGANASSVVSFAKAIAPVASTIGMSETSVLGLSTAMSRLGEDGYRAANAFNKVLLDLQKSVSTGSPEIREYARVLGTTQENLRDMMKSNPTEVILQFTEAIQKQGADSIRTLSNLGLEGVSTFKAISALSREGNLREVIDTSASAYGGGATEAGAQAALGGVSDQMDRLGESMSQAVANSGKPFLTFLEQVLKAANGVSGAVAGITESELFQKAGTVAAPVSAAVGATSNFIGLASTAAFAKYMFQGAANSQPGMNFRNAMAEGRATGAVPQNMGMMGRLGGAFGVLRGPEDPNAPSATTRMGRLVAGASRAAMNFGALNYRFQAEMIDKGMNPNAPSRITNLGQEVKNSASALRAAVATGDQAAIAQHTAALRANIVAYSQATGAAQNLTRSFVSAAAAAGKMTMQMVAGGLSRVGSALQGVTGMSGPMLAVIAAIGAGMVMKSKADEASARRAELNASNGDGFRTYNEMAEKAGIATKSIATFTQAVEEATSKLISGNNTMEQAFSLTQREQDSAMSSAYEAALKLPDSGLEGGSSPQDMALLGRLILGQNPSSVGVAQFLSDITNQQGRAAGTQTSDALRALYSSDMSTSDFVSQGLDLAAKNRSTNWTALFGDHSASDPTEAGQMINQNIVDEVIRQTSAVALTQGDGMANKFQNDQIEKIYRDAVKSKSVYEMNAASEIIAGITNNAENDSFVSALTASMQQAYGAQGGVSGEYKRFLTEVAGDQSYNNAFAQNALSNQRPTPEVPLSQKTALETDAAVAKLVASFGDAAAAATSLGRDLYAGERVAGANATLLADMTPDQIATLTEKQKAIREATLAPEDQTKQTKVGILTARDMLNSGQSANTSRIQILAQLANTTEGDPKRAQLLAAMGSLDQGTMAQRAGRSTVQSQNQRIQLGAMARNMGTLADPEAEKQRQAMIADEQAVYAERVSFMKQFMQQKMQVDRQLEYAQEDYQRNIATSTRDFHRSQADAEHDYNVARKHAIRDFNTQMLYMEQDYLKNRRYQIEDHNKQIQYLMEDAASNLYDPFTRRKATDIFDAAGLSTNLMDQTRALQEQMQNVEKLKKAGLSQATIDQLGLGKTENARQAERLVMDLANDPTLIAQVQAAAELKAKVAGSYATDEGLSKDFRRQEEEFDKGMKRMADAYQTSRTRSVDGFKTSMSDMASQFATQMSRAVRNFNTGMADMLYNYNKARKRALAELAAFGKEAADSGGDLSKDFAKAVENLPGASKNAMIQNTKTMVATMKDNFVTVFDQKFSEFGLTASDLATAQANSNNAIVQETIRASRAAMTAIEKYNSTHNSAQDINSWTYIGDGRFRDKTHNTNFWIDGSGNLTFDPTKGRKNFALGGIATRPTNALIGEAGHAEAVIPLNERGAGVLAAAMGRYVNASDVLRSRVQPYATNVSHSSSSYNYDQKTMFTGPVTVQSQDPNDMARKLAARARRARLAQPVGS